MKWLKVTVAVALLIAFSAVFGWVASTAVNFSVAHIGVPFTLILFTGSYTALLIAWKKFKQKRAKKGKTNA